MSTFKKYTQKTATKLEVEGKYGKKKIQFFIFGNLTKISLKKGEIVVEKFPFPLYFLHV